MIGDDKLSAIARFSNGDARTALNTLEMAVLNGRMDEDAKICVDEDTLAPVSYTHLDVYKRQVFVYTDTDQVDQVAGDLHIVMITSGVCIPEKGTSPLGGIYALRVGQIAQIMVYGIFYCPVH